MSTDLTTTLVLTDDDADDALRVCRDPVGALRVYASDGVLPLRTWLFGEADAIMLRDWLNDEWPVSPAGNMDREEADYWRNHSPFGTGR